MRDGNSPGCFSAPRRPVLPPVLPNNSMCHIRIHLGKFPKVGVRKCQRLKVWSLFQNGWAEAVDTGGCGGAAGANSDGSWRRESRETRWILVAWWCKSSSCKETSVPKGCVTPNNPLSWTWLLNICENEKHAFWAEGICFFWEFARKKSNIMQRRGNKRDKSHLGKENNIYPHLNSRKISAFALEISTSSQTHYYSQEIPGKSSRAGKCLHTASSSWHDRARETHDLGWSWTHDVKMKSPGLTWTWMLWELSSLLKKLICTWKQTLFAKMGSLWQQLDTWSWFGIQTFKK